jgi:glycosyltransferase involved in cell wall biosynthesis
MQLIYIGYWGAHDGLSQSTIYPNLRELARRPQVSRIYYISLERGILTANFRSPDIDPKVEHHPVFSPPGLPHYVTKWRDFRRVRRVIRHIGRTHRIAVVMCRTSLAGYFGLYAKRALALPFFVESFEPHADYMVDSGAWTRGGLKHRFQRRLEHRITQHAIAVSPVSVNHRNHLVANGMDPGRVLEVPCYVLTDLFRPDAGQRARMRTKLQIPEGGIVGIYTGKFGDIYYDQEAFATFAAAARFFPVFFMIILSPEDAASIRSRLTAAGYLSNSAFVGFVKHADVPAYLNAADFAFSTIRPTPSRLYCSPVKNGEYWAAGLPIVLPEGVGDDSEIIRKETAGAILDVNKPSEAFHEINRLIREPNIRERMHAIARRHRSFERQVAVYDRLFEMLS